MIPYARVEGEDLELSFGIGPMTGEHVREVVERDGLTSESTTMPRGS